MCRMHRCGRLDGDYPQVIILGEIAKAQKVIEALRVLAPASIAVLLDPSHFL
jgi:hypothetical protein